MMSDKAMLTPPKNKRDYDKKMHYHYCLGQTLKAMSLPHMRTSKEDKEKAWSHTESCDEHMKKSKAIKHVLKVHKMLLQLPHFAEAQEWDLQQKEKAKAKADELLQQGAADHRPPPPPGGHKIDQSRLPQEISPPIYGHADRKDQRRRRAMAADPCSTNIGGTRVQRPGTVCSQCRSALVPSCPEPVLGFPGSRMDVLCWDAFECHEGPFFAYNPDNAIVDHADGLMFCDQASFGWTDLECWDNLFQSSTCSVGCWIQRWVVNLAYQFEDFFINVVPRWLAEQWEAAKEVIDETFEAIKKEALDAVLDIVTAIGGILPEELRDAIPVFRYLRFSKVYMKCLLDPVSCDWDKLVMPDIEVLPPCPPYMCIYIPIIDIQCILMLKKY